jgi:sugar/nucleoside kinase (ribokinase family)
MLASLGDLVEDVVVRLEGAINVASDTHARIERRRGGSAANTAARAAALGHASRFLGQVGDDAIGAALTAELAADGVDVRHVRQRGSTGTIVALIEPLGERTMLTDRGACLHLDDPDPAWLDGVEVVHVPFYSLATGPIAATSSTVIGWAHERGIAVSIDLSSAAVLTEVGIHEVLRRLSAARPAVVFANLDEAETLALDGPVAGAVTVVKRGALTAVVHGAESTVEVPAIEVASVDDSTGAGDAFAAGFLTSRSWQHDPIAACEAGHRAAADLFRSRAGR